MLIVDAAPAAINKDERRGYGSRDTRSVLQVLFLHCVASFKLSSTDIVPD